MKKFISPAIAAILVLASCKTSKKAESAALNQKPLNCPEKELTFTADIKPIFTNNCAWCHNSNLRAGFNFHKLEFVKKAAESGKLLAVIKHKDGYPPMPRHLPFLKIAGKLKQKNIDKIECWINSGMKE